MTNPKLNALAAVGWNACRKQVYSLCEHIGDEPDNGCPDRFMEGQRYAAKRIARAMGGFEAADCDILRTTLREAIGQGDGLREQLQQRCSDWGAYWRAPDAHGVQLTSEQAHELLRDALGVEVEIAHPAKAGGDVVEASGRSRWVQQSILHSTDPTAPKGDCHRAAIASLLNLPLEAVPDFNLAGPEAWDFWQAVDDFAESHGFWIMRKDCDYRPEGGLYLAGGQSRRGIGHTVVMRDGKLVHDPHPSGEGIVSVDHVWLFIPKDPALATSAGGAVECCVPLPGEPSFVLLGRDPQAPELLLQWAADRESAEPDSDKPAKARAIAASMKAWKDANPGIGMARGLRKAPASGDGLTGEIQRIISRIVKYPHADGGEPLNVILTPDLESLRRLADPGPVVDEGMSNAALNAVVAKTGFTYLVRDFICDSPTATKEQIIRAALTAALERKDHE